jgi:hypothetical protein
VTLRINMWSSPRNLSTAMMYAWRQRSDTTVVDEPIYAHYLRVSGRRHPGDGEVMAAQDPDGEVVVRDVMLGDYETPVVFFKQMAKHLVDLDRSFLPRFSNVLLTREPHDMLTSLQVQLPDATLDDTGFPELVEILDTLLESGDEPVVVDTKLLLLDPAAVLAEMCRRVGLGFDEAMLSWPAGPKPEDGVWARHWYDGVHRSMGWKPYAEKEAVLAEPLVTVLAQAQPMYDRLLPYRIGLGQHDTE